MRPKPRLPGFYDRGPRGFFHRRWIPDKNDPRGGRDEWTLLGKDREEAERRYHEVMAEGPTGPARAGTVEATSAIWLDRYVRTFRDEKGYKNAALRVRKYLVKHLGKSIVRKLTPDDLLLYRRWLEGLKCERRARGRVLKMNRPLSTQTVAHILADAKCFLIWAGQRSAIPKRLLPKVPERPPRGLSATEQAAVRAVAGPRGFACRIMIDSGARPGELCLARAEDLKDGELAIYAPKTRKMRWVPIPPPLAVEIRGHVGKLVPFEPADMIEFNRAVQRGSGVKGFTSYRCRHSFAYNYVAGGGNLAVLQTLMGHASIETTMVYVKPTRELARQDAAKVFGWTASA